MTADGDNVPPWAEGEPAFLPDEGVAYVRAWATAQHAVSALKQALADLGHTDAAPYAHADVNVFGAGIVELGRVTPQTAALIAEALRAMAAHGSRPDKGRIIGQGSARNAHREADASHYGREGEAVRISASCRRSSSH